MRISTWANDSTARAREIWTEYQEQHSLSDLNGRTAGIDPASGRIWFGESVPDVVAQRDAEGIR